MSFAHTYSHAGTSKVLETPIVFVVDGDGASREALESVICKAGWLVMTAASAEEFLARPRITAPCCLLVEQHLPGSSGFELQALLCDRSDMPIIFMSRDADVEATVRAMKAGALEFLTKPFGDGELLSAVAEAIQRSHAVVGELAQLRELRERYALLSPREREVMKGVVSGRLNKQIGGDLGISEITVKAHRGRVMRKMHADSLAELVRLAAKV